MPTFFAVVVVLTLLMPAWCSAQQPAKRRTVQPPKAAQHVATSATQTRTTTDATVEAPQATHLSSTHSTATTSTTVSTSATARSTNASKQRVPSLWNVLFDVPPVPPLKEHGRLMMSATEASIAIHKSAVQWLDYNGVTEILAEQLQGKLPVMPLMLGGQGLMNHLAVLGARPRDVAVMFNGRSLNEAAFGTCAIDQISPELAENFEILIGSDAALFANNAAGALVNIQERLFNTKRPTTRVWYAQANANYLAGAVEFAYNVANNLHLSLGVRPQNSADVFPNTALRSWNVNATVRWDLSSQATLSLAYLYTQHRTGANGGLVELPSDGTAFSAQPLFGQMEELVDRHDITLSGSIRLGGSNTANSANSTNSASETAWLPITGTASAAVYASAAQWHRAAKGSGLNSLTTFSDPFVPSTFGTVSLGATGRMETQIRLGALQCGLTAGGELGLQSVGQDWYFLHALYSTQATLIAQTNATQGLAAAFGRLNINLSDVLALSGGIRTAVVGNAVNAAFGGRATFSLGKLELFADASRSFRLPSVAENLRLGALRSEAHLLGIAGASIGEPQMGFSASAMAFYRFVENPILARAVSTSFSPFGGIGTERLFSTESFNGRSETVLGASVQASARFPNVLFGNLLLAGFAQAHRSTLDDGTPTTTATSTISTDRLPLLYTGATAQYEYVVGRSVLRLGIRARMMTGFRGERFIAPLWTYIRDDERVTTTNIEQGITGNGLDILAGAEVGNAYIRVTYQNALGQQYVFVPVYPMYSSVLRLSVTWTFFD